MSTLRIYQLSMKPAGFSGEAQEPYPRFLLCLQILASQSALLAGQWGRSSLGGRPQGSLQPKLALPPLAPYCRTKPVPRSDLETL